jgi:hypothetical protein
MAAPSVPPSDDALRGFLLGILAGEHSAQIQAWLDADPDNAARLGRIAARDSLTDAVSNSSVEDSPSQEAVARVVHAASEAVLLKPSNVADDPARDGTVLQTRPPSLEHSPAWPPVKLGQFRVVRELGRGGMGYVFEAEDEKLGRRVAVKVLTPELARRPDAAARFLREARAAAKVEHEHVVPILHVGEECGLPFIVMPLLKGESLADRLKRGGRLPAAEAARVGLDVAAGLGAAHARGVVHRDVKPANVWLDSDAGRARVLDFGLARLADGADALTDSRALTGTPAYMAPEQLDGQPATVRSDLFSLGATLYECVTGAKAFDGPTVTAILNAVNRCRPRPVAELSPDAPPPLAALIERLLRKNPAERPADAREVAAGLVPESGAGGGEGVGTVARHDSESRPGPRRTRGLWLIGCGIAAVLALSAAVWLATRPPTQVVQVPPTPKPPDVTPRKDEPLSPVRYTGKVDVRLARAKGEPLLRLNEAGALPMRQADTFRIEGEVDPPAYLYLVWVDPDRDVTPVYPWNAAQGWGSRPAKEEPVGRVSLPANAGNRYTAPKAKPGVATMVLFARPTPLDVPDAEVERWFKELPELPLPPDGDEGVVWFDDFVEVKDPKRLRTFGEVGSDDPFARWQGQLQKSLSGKISFQAAVSFARTGRK